ncbi:MAG TPA: 50S ribosomal protein L6 [Pirellulaceae bacterium]|nr:50S ribosomal protein L6 [Pirellulaceae bacterium]HMO92192.1 50S ribosomal protein L6 [Pirellulaceae bacterium]HMP68881.1 50S ribosomal protein L6 [Pirellulaceae bacterium]
MSRIGKKPVAILDGVKVSIDGRTFKAEGPGGVLTYELRPEVDVAIEGNEVVITRKNDLRESRAYHGTTRALIQNMILGAKQKYEKKLELHGVGYVCSSDGKQVSLRVGFANEVKKKVPEGIEVSCPDNTHIHIKGCSKQLVGQFASELRAVRKPEPYKGKGVRYVGEVVKIKQGKSAS